MSKKDGLRPDCKICSAKTAKLYSQKNRDKLIKTAELYRRENREKLKKASNKYYQDHKVERKQYQEDHKKESKLWRNNHKNERLEYNKTHKKQINTTRKKYYLNKLKNNSQHRLRGNISRRIRDSLKNNKRGTWENLVNYSLLNLTKHIEYQFTTVMDWDNYGNIWSIDHKMPVASYKFKTFKDPGFKNCWALRNLQPMLVIDNIAKKNSLNHASQMGCFSTI